MDQRIKYNKPVWLTSSVDSDVLFKELRTVPSVCIATASYDDKNNLRTSYSDELKLLKSKFENYQFQNIQFAHKKINQYEKVGSLFFQNRAAVKLLNINADTGYILNRSHFKLGNNDIFFFADLCGGMYFDVVCIAFIYFSFFQVQVDSQSIFYTKINYTPKAMEYH